MADSRFSTTDWSDDDRFGSSDKGFGDGRKRKSPKAKGKEREPSEVSGDGEDGDDGVGERAMESDNDQVKEDVGDEREPLASQSTSENEDGKPERVVKPLTPAELAKFQARQRKSGIVYISRIPPGMKPAKVKHILGQFGEIGRVFLQQEDAANRRKGIMSRKTRYTEGWVEFTDKKVAKVAAEMLNARPIGGKKGSPWRDDIWTMKYLPGFKWNMLTEQIAYEKASHESRLRTELTQSRVEQRDYLKKVERARVMASKEEKRARKRLREEGDGGAESGAGRKGAGMEEEGKEGKGRKSFTFTQRKPIFSQVSDLDRQKKREEKGGDGEEWEGEGTRRGTKKSKRVVDEGGVALDDVLGKVF